MSESSIKKSCDYFRLSKQEIEKYSPVRKAILIADSKGNYIKDKITTESKLNIKFITRKGWKIQEVIDWAERELTNECRHFDKITCYIWLGTCNLTEYTRSSKYITLQAHNDSNVKYLKRKFIELKHLIQSSLANSKVVFLEVPAYSIQWWNRKHGHKTPTDFATDDQLLQDQIYQLNKYIVEINGSEELSPKFELDQRKVSVRKGKKDEYYNFNLMKDDGVHPSSNLATLWLRRIANKILKQCFTKRGQN